MDVGGLTVEFGDAFGLLNRIDFFGGAVDGAASLKRTEFFFDSRGVLFSILFSLTLFLFPRYSYVHFKLL